MKKAIIFIVSLLLLCSCSAMKDSKLSKAMGTQVDKTYYPNGSLREEETRIYGLLEGPSKSYYENGQLKEDNHYTGNQLEGLSKTYYPNGALKEEANYVQGQMEGLYTLYCENGNVQERNHFKSGKYDGKIEKYYNCTPTLSETKSYVNGVLEGPREIYYPDGKLKEAMTYANGSVNGLKQTFYPDGNKKEEEQYANGRYNGISRYYFPNGTLMLEVPYVNEKKHGIEKLYYKRGNIQKETPYENGLINGTVKQYAGSGYLWLTENYKNGKLHGKSVQYSKSGRVIKQVEYKSEEAESPPELAAQNSDLKPGSMADNTVLAAPAITVSDSTATEAAQEEDQPEPYSTESGYLLRYRIRKGIMWHYKTKAKAHAQSGYSKCGMAFEYGIESGTDVNSQSLFTLNLIKKSPDKNALIRVSMYDMNLDIRSLKGNLETDCSNVIERNFDMTLSPLGKELKFSGTEDMNIDIRNNSKEDLTLPLQDFFTDIFLDLPEKPVKPGDGWKVQTKDESKTPKGFDRVMDLDNAYVLEGLEKINDRECLKIKGSIKGNITVTGQGPEDEAIRLNGFVDGTVVVFFDPENGAITKTTIESSTIGRMFIRPRTQSEFEQPYRLTREFEMVLEQ